MTKLEFNQWFLLKEQLSKENDYLMSSSQYKSFYSQLMKLNKLMIEETKKISMLSDKQ